MSAICTGISYNNDLVDDESSHRNRVCYSADTIDRENDGDRNDHWQNVQAFVIKRLPSKQKSFSDKTSSRSLERSYSVSTRLRRSTVRKRRKSSADWESSVDLLDAGGLVSDEEEAWRKRETIKGMTASLDFKRQVRDELLMYPTSSMTDYQKWKLRRKLAWKRTKAEIREFMTVLQLWHSAFKRIEGRFGMGVLSYFQFLKFLLLLNIVIALLMFCVVTIPQLVFRPSSFSASVSNVTDSLYPVSPNSSDDSLGFVLQSKNCSDTYRDTLNEAIRQSNVIDKILDLLQGTGWMERTILFYGIYFNKTVIWVTGDAAYHYNMPVAYLMAVLAYFIVSLIVMVTRWAGGVRQGLTQGESKLYCNIVFCGWEYGITDEKAFQKQKSLYQEMRNNLEEDRQKILKKTRTAGEKCKLVTIRFIVNIFVVATWAGAGFLIYYSSVKSLELQGQPNVYNSAVLLLLVEYLPSITITGLNMIIPTVFQKIVILEKFSPAMEIKLTLWRTVLLRLASLTVLVLTLYNIVVDCNASSDNGKQKVCGNCENTGVQCWESYVGQQFYKLVLLDFIVVTLVILLVEFPRKFVVSQFPGVKLIQFVGLQEFDIPKNVLDLVYGQALCWLGGFFSPLIPAVTVAKLIIYFYLKKVSLMNNCSPAERTFRASRSNSFFIAVLLMAYILCALVVAFCIGRIQPSQGCGPFRVYSQSEYYMFTSVTDTVAQFPTIPRDILQFLSTWMFLIPLIVLLGLIIYYYVAKSSGYKRKIEILNAQLASEGKDKQFLLKSVNDAVMSGEIK